MFFKKKRKMKEIASSNNDVQNEGLLENLVSICGDGVVFQNAFILEDEDIYVYADVLSFQDNVAQIVFQLHHEWLDEPVSEVIAAVGDSKDEVYYSACEQFYEQVLQVYLKVCNKESYIDTVEIFTQEMHRFHVWKSPLGGIGKKEGIEESDYWNLLKNDLSLRLGNRKVYAVKVFASKQKREVECEVMFNGKESRELSRKLLSITGEWDCIGDVCTERQWIFLMQDEDTYIESDIDNQTISKLTYETIALLEDCDNKEEYQKIRQKLLKRYKDTSLVYEVLYFIPELYTKAYYMGVEFGEKLFLIQKDHKTRELYQSQLQSFPIVERCVEHHLQKEILDDQKIKKVMEFSVNAKAIQKALENGEVQQGLQVSGIGYVGKSDYILR